jgi:hypothetical protein
MTVPLEGSEHWRNWFYLWLQSHDWKQKCICEKKNVENFQANDSATQTSSQN